MQLKPFKEGVFFISVLFVLHVVYEIYGITGFIHSSIAAEGLFRIYTYNGRQAAQEQIVKACDTWPSFGKRQITTCHALLQIQIVLAII
ncbi:hypothetical protein Ancab_025455 [Ancistrocladus abbreviatus]